MKRASARRSDRYNRLSQLVQEKVVGRAEVDTAQSQVESLKARIALARQQVEVAQSQVAALEVDLADMVVRAPFDGVAISKDAQPGEMISPVSAGGGFTRTGICTIVDMSSLEIEVDVSESYINRVKPSQPVEAILDAYPDWRIPAHVITTVPTADRQKATVRVRIGFEALEPRILPDMGVKVSFFNEKQAETADAPAGPRLLVPKGAVRTDAGQTIVFVVHDDRAERRAVKAGASEGEQIEIISGLNAGERIVVDGVGTLDRRRARQGTVEAFSRAERTSGSERAWRAARGVGPPRASQSGSPRGAAPRIRSRSPNGNAGQGPRLAQGLLSGQRADRRAPGNYARHSVG